MTAERRHGCAGGFSAAPWGRADSRWRRRGVPLPARAHYRPLATLLTLLALAGCAGDAARPDADEMIRVGFIAAEDGPVTPWQGVEPGAEEAVHADEFVGRTQADGRFVYTANGVSNDASEIPTESLTVTRTIAVGERPWGVAYGPVR